MTAGLLKRAGMDVDQIAPRLYQGAHVHPEVHTIFLKAHGFGLHVLCARELQPNQHRSMPLLRVHMDDCGPHEAYAEFLKAQKAAKTVFGFLDHPANEHTRVLITCHLGINRSGLVMALVLRLMGHSPQEAIKTIRERRPKALQNRAFLELIEGAS